MLSHSAGLTLPSSGLALWSSGSSELQTCVAVFYQISAAGLHESAGFRTAFMPWPGVMHIGAGLLLDLLAMMTNLSALLSYCSEDNR